MGAKDTADHSKRIFLNTNCYSNLSLVIPFVITKTCNINTNDFKPLSGDIFCCCYTQKPGEVQGKRANCYTTKRLQDF